MKAIVEIDIPADYTDEYKQWVIDGRLYYLEDGIDEKRRPRYAYYLGTYFEWDEHKEDFIRQVTLPFKYYQSVYGICVYDEPVVCAKVITLQEAIERYTKSNKSGKKQVIFTDHSKEGTDAFLTSLIMKEIKENDGKN